MEYLTLNNGIQIPKLGYGVYQIPPNITEECVLNALKVGYRHIDTAYYYHNEREVGNAIRKSGIPREELFITTKITGAKNYDDACRMIDEALEKLQTTYIDLMLIHWPHGDNVGMYKAMEDYYERGKLRSIGLSNFYNKDLENILKNTKIVPVVNQLETHVFRNQKEGQKLLLEKGIILESWSPLGSGSKKLFRNKILLEIANKHHKSVAQVALRYLYERDVLLIPRSKNSERMKENFEILDFSLDEDDIKQIETLDRNRSLFGWF